MIRKKTRPLQPLRYRTIGACTLAIAISLSFGGFANTAFAEQNAESYEDSAVAASSSVQTESPEAVGASEKAVDASAYAEENISSKTVPSDVSEDTVSKDAESMATVSKAEPAGTTQGETTATDTGLNAVSENASRDAVNAQASEAPKGIAQAEGVNAQAPETTAVASAEESSSIDSLSANAVSNDMLKTSAATEVKIQQPVLAVIGDSFSDGADEWPAIVSKDNGYRLVSKATGGAGFTTGTIFESQLQSLSDQLTSADTLVVYGGVNDWNDAHASVAAMTQAFQSFLKTYDSIASKPLMKFVFGNAGSALLSDQYDGYFEWYRACMDALSKMGMPGLVYNAYLWNQNDPAALDNGALHPSSIGQANIAYYMESILDGSYQPSSVSVPVSNRPNGFYVDADLRTRYAANGSNWSGELPYNGRWYYLDPSKGSAVSYGFTQVPVNGSASKWVYYNGQGQMVYGEQPLNGHWYLFDQYTGEMAQDFQLLSTGNGSWKWVYYAHGVSPSAGAGQMVYGEQPLNGHWYMFDTVTGAVQYGFYLHSYAPKWVFYDRTMGWMLYGEQCIDNGWYYLTPGTGAVDYEWAWIPTSGKWVYYDPVTGRMWYGAHMINGRPYYFDNVTGRQLSAGELENRLVAQARFYCYQHPNTDAAIVNAGGYTCSGGPCMSLVWYIFRQAGLSLWLEDGATESYPQHCRDWYRARGRVDGSPRVGDICFMYYIPFPGGREVTHAGIVTAVSGASINVVDALAVGITEHTMSRNDWHILSYGHPYW